MITPQHTCTLAVLVGILALGMHPPAKAQSARADSTISQIEDMALARASAVETGTAQAFETALQVYERCHWLPAFEQLVRLADRGHAQSARLVMQMHQYGPALFGQAFALSPDEMDRFARVRWQAQGTHATSVR
jgi:hypothetical protein